MSAHFARALTRHSRVCRSFARNASTTSEAANTAAAQASKAKDAAAQAASKAQGGLSKVTSSAGPALNKAAGAAGNALNSLGKVGGRTGQLFSFVQSLVPPTVYYSKVGIELAKLVAKGRGMSPPSVANFQSSYQPLLNYIRNPSAAANTASSAANSLNPNTIVESLKNLSNAQLVAGGIVAAEALGFFTVGEIIGRLKLVGYRSSGAAAHGAEH